MATPGPRESRRLTLVEIVMNADAELIKAAYEARVEVDKLLAQREEAYRRIAELEAQIERTIGQEGVFVFPPPPLPVAGLETASPRPRRTPKSAPPAAGTPAPEKPGPAAEPAPADGNGAAEPAPAPADKPHPARGDGAERPAGRAGGSSSRSHGE